LWWWPSIIAKTLPLPAKKVGSPWEIFSFASGSFMQSLRTRSMRRWSEAECFLTG
jgi:hypothetical protein